MSQYLIELSKYLIAACMIVYTIVSICYFGAKSHGAKKAVSFFQNFFMLLVQFFCFLTLTLVSRDYRYLFFFAIIQFFLFASIFFVTIFFDRANRFLLNNMCMLLGIGLCMIARLSGIGTETRILASKALRQYVIVVISLVISLLITGILLKFKFLRKLTWLYGIAGVILLSAVLVLSEVTHGAKLTYTFLGITFQPSEFVKILFLFYLAAALQKKASFGNVLFTAVIAGLHVIILTLSKDLGSALIFFVAYIMVVFVATGNVLYLFLGLIGGSLASAAAYRYFDHVRVRVLAWRDPWNYIDDQGYQVTQSLFAIGSGNWFGMGLLKGNPKAIPFVDVDMIFSSVCEELGVIFGICLILVSLFSFLEMMRIAAGCEDRFFRLLVYGIGVMYVFQIFLTVGGGIKFIPLTGVTFPFVSYGGSSVMASMFMFFVVQAGYISLQGKTAQQILPGGAADEEMTEGGCRTRLDDWTDRKQDLRQETDPEQGQEQETELEPEQEWSPELEKESHQEQETDPEQNPEYELEAEDDED